MQAYSVVEYYYDNCNVWDVIDGYYFNEGKAYEKLLEIQSKYEDENMDPDHYWVTVEQIEIQGEPNE